MDNYVRRARDPAQTRRRILEAAVAEFAARGFSGGRVDRIAREAGLNKRMLYHYFGDKRGLFEAVLERASRAAGGPGRRSGSATAARVLVWALLEPVTADAALAVLTRAGSRAATGLAGEDVAVVLLRGLWNDAAPPASPKPRVRLKHGPAGRSPGL